jgi:hypothetical protein
MKRILLIALLSTVSILAIAATARVSWVNPTTNTDGSSIPATGAGSLTDARVEWGTCNGAAFGTSIGERVLPTPGTPFTTPDLSPGTYCFRVFVGNTYGVASDPSNVASKVVAAPKPNAPTNFTVE